MKQRSHRPAFRPFLLLLLFMAAHSYSQDNDKREKFEEYNNYFTNAYRAADWKMALYFSGRMLEVDSSNATVHFARANLFRMLAVPNTDSALYEINQAIRLESKNEDYYKWRAGTYFSLRGDSAYAKAMKDYKMVLLLDSFYYQAYERLTTYYCYRNTKEASRYRKLARRNMLLQVKQDSTVASSWYYLGMALRISCISDDSPDLEPQAFHAFTRCIELDSTYAAASWERGVLNSWRKQYRDCISDMKRAGRYHDSGIYHVYIASAYEDLKELQNAMDAVEEGLRLFPDDFQLKDMKSKLEKEMKKK